MNHRKYKTLLFENKSKALNMSTSFIKAFKVLTELKRAYLGTLTFEMVAGSLCC